eukprot:2700719-Rhodomonas_salina.1
MPGTDVVYAPTSVLATPRYQNRPQSQELECELHPVIRHRKRVAVADFLRQLPRSGEGVRADESHLVDHEVGP